MVKTAIVILNWNGLDFLKRFLGNVMAMSVDDSTAVYVADNGSTDGSCEWIAGNQKDVYIIRLNKNYGFAGGYNRALGQISAKYYVLLNSDIEVTEGWLRPLVSYMENNPDVASCQPKILSLSRRDCFEYAGASGGFIDRYGYPFCRGRIFGSIEKDMGQYDLPGDIFWSSGACMIVRSEAWERCKGFDEDFFAHMEEIDLCWRFHRTGYRVSVIPGSSVYHVGGGALPYNSPFKTYLNFRNSLFLLYKNLPDKHFSAILFFRKILDGLAAFFFLARGEISSVKAVWRAHRDVRRKIPHLLDKRKQVQSTGDNYPSDHILNKSIVFEFYIKRHRTFSSLKTKLFS